MPASRRGYRGHQFSARAFESSFELFHQSLTVGVVDTEHGSFLVSFFVQEEARLLGVEKYFQGRIYGALDGTDENTKVNLIKRIFRKEMVRNKERVMIVMGDGPVEMKSARENGVVAVGVTSNEQRGSGWSRCSHTDS